MDNKKIAVVLKEVTKPGESVKIKVTTDDKSVIKQVNSFVEQFNTTVKNLKNNDSMLNKDLLDLSKLAKQNRFALEDIGISVKADGTLKVDEKKLESALKSNFTSVKNLLEGSGGLATIVGKKSQAIVNTPVIKFASSDYLKNYTAGSFLDFLI